MTLSQTRADMVLDAVLLELPRSRVTESRSVRVHDSWTEGEDVICVLNAYPGIDALVGLRRRVSAELPLEEEVDEISNFEIGEPLGRWFNSDLIVDGVFWWDGGPRTGFGWDQRREAAARLAAQVDAARVATSGCLPQTIEIAHRLSRVTDAQSTVSPDGRFRWNGQRWVPTRKQQRRTWLLALAILGGIVGLLLVLFLIVFGPVIVELFKVFD